MLAEAALNSPERSRTTPILFGIFVAFIILIGAFVGPLSRFEFIEIETSTGNDMLVSVYRGLGTVRPSGFDSRPVGGAIVFKGGHRVTKLPTRDYVIRYFKLGFSEHGVATIHQVRFLSHYAPSRVVKGKELGSMFAAADQHTHISLTRDGIVITGGKNGHANIATTRAVFASSVWLELVVPMMFGVLAYMLASHYSMSSIPAFHDMVNRDVGERVYRVELDGLRGLAALSVVAEHTWGRFQGIGGAGVWIFFILSGFLLAQPFISEPKRALDRSYLARYLVRRVARIVPMFYLTVLLLFALSGHVDKLFDHFLFIQADGHLWTVQQEMFFYVVLPMLVIVLYMAHRLKPGLALVVLLAAAVAMLYRPYYMPVRLYEYGGQYPPYLGFFVAGMLIAYIYAKDSVRTFSFSQSRAKTWVSVVGFLAMATVAFFSTNPLTEKFGFGHNLVKTHTLVFGLGCSLVLLAILLSHGKLLSHFFSMKWLRSIGVVGYSYYLLHPMVATEIIDFSRFYTGEPLYGGRLFLVTAVVTWIISIATYSLVEKPFMAAAKQFGASATGIVNKSSSDTNPNIA